LGESTPVSIGRRDPPGPEVTELASTAAAIGLGVSAMLRHLVAVLDREDRLESGSGEWLAGFRADAAASRAAVQQSVLRALHLASDPVNFEIMDAIADAGNPHRVHDLCEMTGLPELSLAERVSDLVSAGLATKVPGANQVTGTQATQMLVRLVRDAVDAGVRDLGAT